MRKEVTTMLILVNSQKYKLSDINDLEENLFFHKAIK